MRPLTDLMADERLRLGDLLAAVAAARPDAPALATAEGIVTRAGLQARIAAARDLLAAHGVRPGDRVMVVQENAPAAIALFLGTLALDACIAPVNARLAAREVAALRTLCDPRLVLHLPDLSPDAALHAEAADAQLLDHPLLGRLALEPVRDSQAEPAARQVAAMVFSSGSTGRPKGIMLTHRGMAWNTAAVMQERRYAETDRVYGIAPLTHSLGLGGILLPTLAAGAVYEVVQRLDVADLAAAVTRRGVTVLNGPPALYARLLGHAERAALDLSRTTLRILAVGSAPLDPALKARVEAAFGLPLCNGYGVTEAGPSIAFGRPGAPAPGLSVGPPLPMVETRIVDAAGRDQPRGAEGELWVRSPGVMAGYWRDAAATAEAFAEGGWLRTGDIATMDAAGNLSILGRTKELIIRGGFNVHPAEIENLIAAQPGVALAAVIGRKTGHDEEILAFVQPAPDGSPDLAAIAAALARDLAPYKRPARILLVPALPVSPTGKVQKARLAELLP
jgi:acyl-CoA synthetase (AMP-forming)/AMP-acid ligase II